MSINRREFIGACAAVAAVPVAGWSETPKSKVRWYTITEDTTVDTGLYPVWKTHRVVFRVCQVDDEATGNVARAIMKPGFPVGMDRVERMCKERLHSNSKREAFLDGSVVLDIVGIIHNEHYENWIDP